MALLPDQGEKDLGWGGLILVTTSQYILIIYHVPGRILSALWVLAHLTLTQSRWKVALLLHFIDEKTEAQRG